MQQISELFVNERNSIGIMRSLGSEVEKVKDFKCSTSAVQSNRECGKEGKRSVQTDWNGWRKISVLV